MKTRTCSCGLPVLLDDDIYESLQGLDLVDGGTSVHVSGDTKQLAYRIIDIPKGMMADHKNRNYHDYQRSNLRVATRSQNSANSKIPKHNSFGYKWVICKGSGWGYQITCNKKTYSRFKFPTIEAAALAANKKAKELFGEFAYQNEVKV